MRSGQLSEHLDSLNKRGTKNMYQVPGSNLRILDVNQDILTNVLVPIRRRHLLIWTPDTTAPAHVFTVLVEFDVVQENTNISIGKLGLL